VSVSECGVSKWCLCNCNLSNTFVTFSYTIAMRYPTSQPSPPVSRAFTDPAIVCSHRHLLANSAAAVIQLTAARNAGAASAFIKCQQMTPPFNFVDSWAVMGSKVRVVSWRGHGAVTYVARGEAQTAATMLNHIQHCVINCGPTLMSRMLRRRKHGVRKWGGWQQVSR